MLLLEVGNPIDHLSNVSPRVYTHGVTHPLKIPTLHPPWVVTAIMSFGAFSHQSWGSEIWVMWCGVLFAEKATGPSKVVKLGGGVLKWTCCHWVSTHYLQMEADNNFITPKIHARDSHSKRSTNKASSSTTSKRKSTPPATVCSPAPPVQHLEPGPTPSQTGKRRLITRVTPSANLTSDPRPWTLCLCQPRVEWCHVTTDLTLKKVRTCAHLR